MDLFNNKKISKKLVIILIIIVLIITNFMVIFSHSNNASIRGTIAAQENTMGHAPSRGSTRGARAWGFTPNSTGLLSSGEYSCIGVGDIDGDSKIDIAFGGENYSGSSHGLYVYTGNGAGVWTQNIVRSSYKYGGIAIEDCDADSNQEIYACYQLKWGSGGSSDGVGAWEWTGSGFSTSGISSPITKNGTADLVIKNITGGPGLDMAVATQTAGLKCYEGSGSSPISWTARNTGLPSTSEYTNIEVEDINKDGRPDIIAGAYSTIGLVIYTQDSGGTSWTSRTSSLPSSAATTLLGVTVGDVNGDTHMDIVYGTRDNGMETLLGNSGGVSGTDFVWTTPTPTGGGFPTSATSGRFAQIQLADVDLDGDLDLLAPKATSGGGLHIYLGNGSINPGTAFGFTEATGKGLPTSGSYYGSAYLDFNNDGALDVAGASWGAGVKVFGSNLSTNIDLKPPGAVSDMVSTNVTTSTITVNWTVPADNGSLVSSGPVQSYDIRYSTINITLGNWDAATEATGEPTPATPGTKQNFTLTSLNQGTKYYIALRSQDERPNLSPLSNIVEVSTLGIVDTTLPGKVNDLQAIEPTNNSINLTWTAPADNGSDIFSGPVTEYDIRYASAEITNATWATANIISHTITPSTPGLLEKLNVPNLQAETTYYFAMKARDERPNWGWLSNSAFNTTLPDPDIIPPATITDLTAVDPTETTINLTWTATGDDGTSGGNASYYDIRYSTLSITTQNWATTTECTNEPMPKDNGTTEYFQVTGLDSNTTYFFAIKVADEELGWSGLSNIATNKTLESVDTIIPGRITDLTAKDETETTVTLTWTAHGDDADVGNVSGYEIRYNTERITDIIWSISKLCPDYPTPKGPGQKQSYTVTGLLSSKKYYFAVKAFDEQSNYSPLSNIAEATTLESDDNAPPAAITDLMAATISESSIRLTWTAPGDDDLVGVVTGYDIRFATSQITDTSWGSAKRVYDEPTPKPAGNKESFVLAGLFSGTKYYFAIQSFDEKPNYSELSNVPSATTYSSDDSIPPAAIDDLEVVETGESTVTLNWTATGDDGDQGTATAYDIRYSKAAITGTNWDSAIEIPELPTPKPAGKKETFIVTGLDQGTTYYFAIKAGDEVPNWSPISNSPQGKTTGTYIPKLLAGLTFEKSPLRSGENTKLTISVTSEITLNAVPAAEVTLSSDNTNLVINPKTGQTDQNGKLVVTIKAPSVTTATTITIIADITKTGFIGVQENVKLIVEPIPEGELDFNLHVNELEIFLSHDPIIEGDTITIYANIKNLGPTVSSGYTVKFYIDGIQIGKDKSYTYLEINTTLQLQMLWNATLGNHTLKIEIVTAEPEFESDSSDNIATKIFTVIEKESDDGDKKDKKEDNTLFLLLISIIIIVVIILVLFLALRKRKGKPTHEELFEEEGRIEEGTIDTTGEGMPPAPEGYEQEYMQDQPYDEQQQVAEDTLITEEVFETQEGQEFETPLEGEEFEAERDEEEEFLAEVEAELESLESKEIETDLETEPGVESTEIPSEAEEPAQDQIQQEQEIQTVSCPTCQNTIAVYSNPCPYCKTELDW